MAHAVPEVQNPILGRSCGKIGDWGAEPALVSSTCLPRPAWPGAFGIPDMACRTYSVTACGSQRAIRMRSRSVASQPNPMQVERLDRIVGGDLGRVALVGHKALDWRLASSPADQVATENHFRGVSEAGEGRMAGHSHRRAALERFAARARDFHQRGLLPTVGRARDRSGRLRGGHPAGHAEPARGQHGPAVHVRRAHSGLHRYLAG